MERRTDERIKCLLCERGNNFIVTLVSISENEHYLITKCPSCGHHDECRRLTFSEAAPYLY